MARLRENGDLDYSQDEYQLPAAPRPGAPYRATNNQDTLDDLNNINKDEFPNFDPTTGLNKDGTTVTGPTGDPSHQAAPPPPTAPAPDPYAAVTPGGGAPAPTGTIQFGDDGKGRSIDPTGPSPTTGPNENPLSAFMERWLADQNAATAKTAGQRQSLLARINGLSDEYAKPVTGDDPSIKNQVFDYSGKVDRANRKYREQAAERAHAEGVGSGAFDAQLGNATLEGGRAVGDFEHGLVHDEISQRREKLMETLKQGAGLLSDEDQAGIQNRIASMDAMIKGRGMDLTNDRNNNDLRLGLGNLDLGSRGLDLQKLLGMSSIDLQRELGLGNLAIAGRNAGTSARSVDNQNNQFYDKFAYDQGRDANNSDEDIIRRLLGE